jgi:arabinose-5-phosphate isomerase
MNENVRSALYTFIHAVQNEFDAFAQSTDYGAYAKAAQLILDAKDTQNRVHITGIGKPAHVAAYAASLISSTGTPAYFLHGTEAVHGSSGQLVAGDVVICISNSGETAEMKATAMAIKNNGCKIIAITGNPESWLAKQSDAHLFAGVNQEGGPLNRAPRASILVETFALQMLSILLQANRGLTPQEYVMWHPSGTLGKLRDNEK